VIEKIKPTVDKRYGRRSVVERGLVDIMEKCWVDPAARISIFDVVQKLHDLRNVLNEGTSSL
jgi:hypothetical protein